jgi:hypothetical protein
MLWNSFFLESLEFKYPPTLKTVNSSFLFNKNSLEDPIKFLLLLLI